MKRLFFSALPFVLAGLALSALPPEKRLLGTLTPQQKSAVFEAAKRECVLIRTNDGKTLMVRHAHGTNCSEPDENDGSRLCDLQGDGKRARTYPVTAEAYEKHLRDGGYVPAVIPTDVVKPCGACDGTGRIRSSNETKRYEPMRITRAGNLAGGRQVTDRGMDTVSFCTECRGTGKVTVVEDRECLVFLQ